MQIIFILFILYDKGGLNVDWIKGMQRAIDYIEENLLIDLNYSEISKHAYVSEFHFQRVFSILCGYTVGEYIKSRRLSLAAEELSMSDVKIIDIAFKYGYETSESFSKAFARFHGVTPKKARESGAKLKSFCRLIIKISLEGGKKMDYMIEKKEGLTFVGYKTKFEGGLHEREKAEEEFWINTRDKQEALKQIWQEEGVWYTLSTNFNDYGFEHYIAVKSDAECTEGFERINLSGFTYAIFSTEECCFPTRIFMDLRKHVISEWLPSSDYILANGPEITVIYWHRKPNKGKRYIELWIPVNKK